MPRDRWVLRALPALGLALLFFTANDARAGELRELPVGASPRSLQMRASAWRVAAQDPRDPGGQDSQASSSGGEGSLGSGGIDRLESRQLEADVKAPPEPLSDKVIFRFNLGMGLDSGLPSGEPMLSGATLGTNNYQRLRVYGFGDAVAGTKGLGVSGLSTYFAAHFRFNQNDSQPSGALPSVYGKEMRNVLVRSAYAESNALFDSAILKPVYVRAGRSYHYDLSVMHYEGVKIGYDTPVLKLSIMSGRRQSLYTLSKDHIDAGGMAYASSIRLDLYEWRRWPVVAFASSLNFADKKHRRGGLALRWNRDILVSSAARAIDGKLARWDWRLRARISKVTTVNVQLNTRFRSDWSYGLLQITTPDDPSGPKPYLDLGPVLPRSVLRVRYGTVLLRNLDVLLRAGAAYDRRDRETVEASSFSSSYVEAGGAAEVRMRRTLRLGAALSSRRYFLSNNKAGMTDPGVADPLPSNLASTGATSFWEGGLNLHYSPGARQFSSNAELYGRRYSLRSEYIDDTTAVFRSGGRFSVEGWVKDRVRLKVEYDLSFGRIAMAPELRDLKTLRVFLEGSF